MLQEFLREGKREGEREREREREEREGWKEVNKSLINVQLLLIQPSTMQVVAMVTNHMTHKGE